MAPEAVSVMTARRSRISANVSRGFGGGDVSEIAVDAGLHGGGGQIGDVVEPGKVEELDERSQGGSPGPAAGAWPGDALGG